MKKQTAVEWLIDNLKPLYPRIQEFKLIIGLAKEMEKQQIMDARLKGDYFCDMPKAEQYYNETFNSEK